MPTRYMMSCEIVLQDSSTGMDRPSQSRITQNIVFLKSALSHLDPIIDRLIEGGIFSLADRNRIEAGSASHKQFNMFIDILTSSSVPNAYRTFRKALKLEGYSTVADKLDQTTPQPPTVRSASSRQSRSRDSNIGNGGATPDGAGASSSNGCSDCMISGSTVMRALESFSRNQEAFIADIQRLRNEDLARMEEQRQRDKEELQKQLNMGKNDIVKEQDATAITRRYISLQEKYEHLKEVQNGMRLKDADRHERLHTLNREHVKLNVDYQKLQHAYAELEQEMIRMQSLLSNQEIENASEKGDFPGENADIIGQLKAEKDNLILRLEEKMSEIETLQRQLDQQKDFRERMQSDQENDQLMITKDREQKFDKMYEMVETLAKERTLAVDDTPRTGREQKVNPAFKTTRMQLKERKPGPIKSQGTKPFNVQLGLDC